MTVGSTTVRNPLLVLLACAACAAPDEEPVAPFELSGTHVLRRLHGWSVVVDRDLVAGDDDEALELGRLALELLAGDLLRITLVVPADIVERMRTTPIWLEHDHPLAHMQYHPDVEWLEEHGHDPLLARCVHVPSARNYVDEARRGEQPWVVLHELAHAFHHRELGFDEPRILAAFEAARASGRYVRVLHVGGRERRHYALTDHKEFFAEMSECYLGTNDFHPFVRGELARTDPDTFALMEAIWSDVSP